MGKKMKIIPFLCQQPRTMSFRTGDKMLLKTINSAYLGATINTNHNGGVMDKPDEPWFANSSESASFSTESDESGCDTIETVIRGARSERLFFEPGDSSSILKEVNSKSAVPGGGGLPFKESLVLSMESHDPYVDFKKSMEEMVKAYGLKDWQDLEELLFSYLNVNGKSNHGYIIGAFVDLLVGIAFASSSSPSPSLPNSSDSCSCSRSPSSPLSFYTSSSSDDCSSATLCVSSSLEEEEEEEAEEEEAEIIDIISPCYSSLGADDENGIKEN